MDTRLLRYIPETMASKSRPKLTPEARWLLLQWSRSPGLGETFNCSVRDLFRHIGMPEHHARPALKLLIRQGYIVSTLIKKGRGRPSSCHRVSEEFRELLNHICPSALHQTELAHLCLQAINAKEAACQQPQKLMTGKERASRLSISNYWLLAVLLAHANTPGIVTGLSQSKLMALTGMPKTTVLRQLSKLKRLGLIAHHERGRMTREDERHMSSVYILNLQHQALLGEDSLGMSAVLIPLGGPDRANVISGCFRAAAVLARLFKSANWATERIQSIFDETEPAPSKSRNNRAAINSCLDALWDYQSSARSLLPSLNLSESLANSLINVHDAGMEPIMSAHLQCYAMWLLSSHWNEIDRLHRQPERHIKSVMAAIGHDCSGLTIVDDDPDSAKNFYALMHHLAVHMAREVKACLQEIDEYDECDFSSAVFLLEPVRQQKAIRWIIRAHFQEGDSVTYLDPNTRHHSIRSVDLSLPKKLQALPSKITRELN